MKAMGLDSLSSARLLAEGLMERGLGGIVFSPGSRNAPLIQAFAPSHLPGGVALDERSAAHHALGMSLALQRPVAVCCTSGTAALNHGPALAEADRSGLPLISLTADRPAGAHLEWQSQTLLQDGLHALHTRAHFTWSPANKQEAKAQLDAMAAALGKGPIHVNCPFEEPLYGEGTEGAGHPLGTPPVPADPNGDSASDRLSYQEAAHAFGSRMRRAAENQERILLLGGTQSLSLSGACLSTWAEHAVIAGDPTSGLAQKDVPVITACDRWLSAWNSEGLPWAEVQPDLIVTFGAPLLSRRLRAALSQGVAEHIHLDRSGQSPNAFGTSCRGAACPVDMALEAGAASLAAAPAPGPSHLTSMEWRNRWWALEQKLRHAHGDAMAAVAWSDLKAHECLHDMLPEDWDLHLGNSTPVRYAALFSPTKGPMAWSNRGAAGIDGCSSTAVGASLAGRRVTLITGELGFLYDANAFHLHPLPTDLRIAVIHNGGGGIFRWLDGPDRTRMATSHFEWQHDTELRPLCDLHGLEHERVTDETALRLALRDWWTPSDAPKVLEIVTPGEQSAAEYLRYMEFVRH